MDRKRLMDILCACLIITMLPCGAYIVRGMSGPGIQAAPFLLQDTVPHQDSVVMAAADTTDTADTVVLTERQRRQMERDSVRKRKDAYLDSVAAIKQAVKDSAHHVRDSLKSVRDSIRWSKPRVLETGFVPDSLYYRRILTWNTGPYVNEYRHADLDTTFNDWYTEYPFYKEDIDAVYLGTIGSATQNVNFFRRHSFDRFKAYAPYLTYSHVPETMPFFNVKAPYTELAYWGTLFAFKEKEEINVRFLHTQNITPELNLSVLFQGWKAAGMLNREATTNNSLEVGANYLGRNYVAHAGLIHHNITREENGGIQDSYMVRDTTVDGKTIGINLEEAQNKLSRNTFFIDHSYSIPLESRIRRMERAMEEDSVFAVSVDSVMNARMEAYEKAMAQARTVMDEQDSLLASSPGDSIRMAADSIKAVMDSILKIPAPTRDGLLSGLADTMLFGNMGEGPMLTVGHVGEVSRYYRYYTDEIGLSDEVGRNFYNNMFYINPTSSADSTRVFTVDNKLFFKLRPWARDAVVSEISGGLGYQWNSIYGFRPDMFLSGNRNVHQHDFYVYAGAGGQYRKYLNWSADARYSLLGYFRNDFEVNAGVDVSFYPFKDRTEPITLSGHFNTSLKEPDWFSQHYWSNHYVWDNDFGKTSTTKVEATLSIPKWRLEASFGYALVNNYLYHDTLGIARQHTGLINVMSGYLQKDFKLWLFHLDNKVLFQFSSDRNILPLPMLTFHMRYYIELEAVKNVLTVQLGADATMNTDYYAPAYNPALGTFQLQRRELIGMNPYIDVFLNMQWKRVNIFVKVINVGQGWPDGGMMFSAYHYVKPYRGFKVGIHWPFYIE